MYVTKKTVRRGEKAYEYWQVVESHWVEGKVKKTVVAHLGPAKDREQADKLARFKGQLCGVCGCGQAADSEPMFLGEPLLSRRVRLSSGWTKQYTYRFCPKHIEEWEQYLHGDNQAWAGISKALPYVPEIQA